MDNIKILFLAADPSDSTRLRLGQELRDIREKLQLAKQRSIFSLESRESVRPGDITQAIFDVEPQIVHFSGHGMNTGELCFEDVSGKTQAIKPAALAGLFELVSKRVQCVILNTCYSEVQATAIADYISFVIGMSKAIGDKAAIAFAVGFYKALGAGRSFEEAYKFACVEIQLEGIPEHLTPVLHKKSSVVVDDNSSRTKYIVILSATIDEINKPLLEAMVAHLRQVSGDTSLTLQKIEAGSVRLILEGSEEGFRQLEALFKTGQLAEILGKSVQGIKLQEEVTSQRSSGEIRIQSTGRGRSATIYIGNLSFQATEDDLKEIFSEYGTVSRVSLPTDRETGRKRGFAFVEMSEEDQAERAVTELDGAEWLGRELKVNLAKPREGRESRRTSEGF
jgi:hypothetical protein